MSVTLKLTFDSIEKAQEFLQSKINVAAPAGPAPVIPVQKAEPDPAATPNPATPAAESAKSTGTENAAGAGKGKGGKGKEAPAPAPAPAVEPAIPVDPLKETDVREKLMAVNNKFGENGLSKVADLLAPFGVQKIGDLKPEQYAEVVKAADAVLA